MQLTRRRDGIALVYALALMVIAAGVALLMTTRVVGEMQNSRDDSAIVQTLLVARGGANMGGSVLLGPVTELMRDIVRDRSSSANSWAFGDWVEPDDGEQPAPDAESVIDALSEGGGSVTAALQDEVDELLCGAPVFDTPEGRAVVRVHFTAAACGVQLPSQASLPAPRFVQGSPRGGGATDQTYALPFVMVAEGEAGEYSRRIVLQGEYRFSIGRASFARYALFTNVHETSDGGDIWFTDGTLFDGPVHTNQFYRYFRSPWFGGAVTSAGCRNPGQTACNGSFNRTGAEFYGQGFIRDTSMNDPLAPSYRNWYGTHQPELTAGVNWRTSFVPMPTNNQDQQKEAERNGLYVSGDIDALQLWAGGDDFDEDDPMDNALRPDGSGGWEPEAEYQYVRVCESSCETYRFGPDRRLERHDDDGDFEPVYRRSNGRDCSQRDGERGRHGCAQVAFTGVIYASDDISRLTGPLRTRWWSDDSDEAPPALASFAQITVAADDDIRVTGDLKYEDPPCDGAPTRQSDGSVTPTNCDNMSAQNVLGVYSQGGDVLIGNRNSSFWDNAPENVEVHGVMMSSRGEVTVEDFRYGSPRGTMRLLGGVIENTYGGFGTFDSRTGDMSTGYGRSFAYDRRMETGFAPPFFPTVGIDEVRDPVVFTFGQREQLY